MTALELALAAAALASAAFGYGWLDAAPPGFELRPVPDGARRVVTWNVGGAGGRYGSTMSDEERVLLATWTPPGGPAIAVASVHANAWSSEGRNATIGRVADALAARAAGGPALLLGDLNLDVALSGGSDLFSDDAGLDLQTYGWLAEGHEDLARGTGPTAEPDRRLDYVFATRGAFTPASAGPWRGRRTGDMDHDPVVVDVVLRTLPGDGPR